MKLYDQKLTIYHASRVAKINCAIVGGESGPGARPVMQEWVTDIRDQCLRVKVPFFFKQWGGVQKKRAG
jgi:protein gp37